VRFPGVGRWLPDAARARRAIRCYSPCKTAFRRCPTIPLPATSNGPLPIISPGPIFPILRAVAVLPEGVPLHPQGFCRLRVRRLAPRQRPQQSLAGRAPSGPGSGFLPTLCPEVLLLHFHASWCPARATTPFGLLLAMSPRGVGARNKPALQREPYRADAVRVRFGS
jgi:hypothetical protein